jgi:hypothetical protein
LRRFKRDTPKSRLRVLAVVAALVLAVPVAWASHQFTDVPDAYPFHDDIGAIGGAGITGGASCPPAAPPSYCPAENVRRDAMAAFLHRGLGRVAYAALPVVNPVPSVESAGPYNGLAITSGVPAGIPSGTGFVKVDVGLTFRLESQGTTPCPCDYAARAYLVNTGAPISNYMKVTLYNVLDVATVSVTGVVPVVGPGVKSVTIHVFRDDSGGGGDGAASVYGDATATYVPFGGTGASTLGGSAGAGNAQQELPAPTPQQRAARAAARARG